MVSIRGFEREPLDQRVEHRPVHALDIAAAHLVPIIAGELELGGGRQLDLRISDEIVETRLAGCLLLEEPAELLERGLFGEPWKERITLAGTGSLQRLEPADEAVRVRRRFGRLLYYRGTQRLQERAFQAKHLRVAGQPQLPIRGRQRRREPLVIPGRKPPLRFVVQMIVRAMPNIRAKKRRHSKSFPNCPPEQPDCDGAVPFVTRALIWISRLGSMFSLCS